MKTGVKVSELVGGVGNFAPRVLYPRGKELPVPIRLRVFENRVLRITLGPKPREVGDWRKRHNGELRNLYASPSLMRMIKLRNMRWARKIA
jgi:hypothetical protein